MAIFYAFFSYAGGEKNRYFKIRPTASVRKVESSLCPHIDNVYFQVFLSVGNTGFFPSRWHIATYQFLALGKGSTQKKRFLSGIARMMGGGSTHARIFWPSFNKCIFGQ